MGKAIAACLFLLLACKGDAGPPGAGGPTGPVGPQGDQGIPGDPGDDGLSCWDADADGIPDPEEDVDSNGVWDARDCGGEPGTDCWDADADGIEDPDEDTNGDDAWNSADCAGDTSGTIRGVVRDRDTGALIEGAEVAAQPLGASMTTGADGAFVFADAPFGVYIITAVGPSLVLSGNSVESGVDVSDGEAGISLLAGQDVFVALSLPRLDIEGMNLERVHTGPGDHYTEANCIACHTDREAETSTDPALPPYHAIGAHANLSCTSLCHSGKVSITWRGWGGDVGATLRKQVDVSACTGCHGCYPSSFCTTCPDPCP